MQDYQEYIQAWRKRLKQEALWATERKRKALAAAERMISVLLEEYKVREVYLFGSLIIPEKSFTSNSDIDLAVSGLSVKEYFKVWRELESMSEFRIDLIDIDRCAENFRQIILMEGKVYEGYDPTLSTVEQGN